MWKAFNKKPEAEIVVGPAMRRQTQSFVNNEMLTSLRPAALQRYSYRKGKSTTLAWSRLEAALIRGITRRYFEDV
jgi:hypothetical protein